MSIHGTGWRAYIRYDEERDRPAIDRSILRRVAGYARPYWGQVALTIGLITLSSLLALIPPLLYRDLLDNALPNHNAARLNRLALGIIGVPLLTGLIGVAQRYLSASIGEGIIFDLRRVVYAHMQMMSLQFFTNTRTGELMSRLNNDVHPHHYGLVGVATDGPRRGDPAPVHPAGAASRTAAAAPHPRAHGL
jgi:ATP-binding cassette subfamily B protein